MSQRKITRKLLSTNISIMEPGQFQEFCLAFFPIYENKYKGLIRHGGTSEGKTRRGHPDLKKADENGKIICVECSTDNEYWKKPKDIEKWKPIYDITECSSEIGVNNISEIVLCSSREIPTNFTAAESEIIEYCKENKYQFSLDIWSLADFEEEIVNNVPKYIKIFEYLIPELLPLINASKDSASDSLVGRLYKDTGKPYLFVEEMASKYIDRDYNEIKELIFKKGQSIYEQSIPEKPILTRMFNWNDINGIPLGKVASFIGHPKIGKTSLLAQLSYELLDDFQIRWFNSPHRDDSQGQFRKDLLMAIFSNYFNPLHVIEYLDGRISFSELTDGKVDCPQNKVLIVIDNSEHILTPELKRINNEISMLRNVLSLEHLAIIFVSSTSLMDVLTTIDIEFSCPRWEKNEIRDLLTVHKIIIPDHLDDYVKILVSKTHGHPLVSLIVAQKYPSIKELLLSFSKIEKYPLIEKELSYEIHKYLFDYLLADSDSKSIVLRASALTFPFNSSELEYIYSSISPIPKEPFKLVFNKLKRTVFEGDSENHISVAYIFKEISNSISTKKEKQKVYSALAKMKLRIENNTIKIEECCQGIFYSLLAEKYEDSFYWAGMILSRVHFDLYKLDELRAIADRLDFLLFIPPPNSEFGLRYYIQLMISFRVTFSMLQDDKYAKMAVKNIGAALVKKSLIKDTLLVKYCEAAYVGMRLLEKAKEKCFAEAVEIMDEIDISVYDYNKPSIVPLLDLLSDMIIKIKPDQFPFKFIDLLFAKTGNKDDNIIASIVSLAFTLAVNTHKNNFTPEDIISRVTSSSPLSSVFKESYFAQFNQQIDDPQKALENVSKALKELEVWGNTSEIASKYLLLLQADLYNNIKDHDKAKELFSRLLYLFENDDEMFYKAWCYHKLGGLEQDSSIAITHFENAIDIFSTLDLNHERSKSMGEVAILKHKSGKIIESLNLLASIIDTYYRENKDSFSSAAMVSISLLGNIYSNDPPKDEAIALENGLIQLGFKRGAFLDVPANLKPTATKITVFYTIGLLYDKYQFKAKRNEYYALLKACEIETKLDAFAYANGIFLIGSSFKERAIRHVEGLDKMVSKVHDEELILHYGYSICIIWANYTYKHINIYDLYYFRFMHDNCKYLGSLGFAKEQISATAILMLLSILDLLDNDVYSDIIKICFKYVIPIMDKLPGKLKSIISGLME